MLSLRTTRSAFTTTSESVFELSAFGSLPTVSVSSDITVLSVGIAETVLPLVSPAEIKKMPNANAIEEEILL